MPSSGHPATPQPSPPAARRTAVYDGAFRLDWLRNDEKVMSAGDGSGAAIIVGPDGERRINVGDEFEVECAPCEVCGRRDDVRYRGWTDEGCPMETCARCGGPDA